MTASSTAAQRDSVILQCQACHSDVPSGAFCGFCGAHLFGPPGDGPAPLRADSYAAEPNEQLIRFSLASSLFPHLPPRSRMAFRMALGLLMIVLVVVALMRWQAALVALIVFGVPALFVAYLRQAGIRGDLGSRVVALTSLAGLVLGATWAYLTGPVLATSYLSGLGVGHGGARLVAQGLSIPVLGALLMIVPAVVARIYRPASRESLDGYAVGARSAVFFTAAAVAVRAAPQLSNGLVAHHKPASVLLMQAGVQGLAMPLTAAAAGGLAGLTLWFSRRGQPRRGPLLGAVLGALAVVVAIYGALGLIDIASLTPAVQLGLHLVVTAIALLALRIGVHAALLREQPDSTHGEAVLCFHCSHVVPDMAFCPNCGVASRASSRVARRARRAVAEAAAGAAGVALFPGYGVPSGSYSAPLPRSTSPVVLISVVGAALAVAVAGVSAISVKATPAEVHYACPPDCGRPPIGPPVGGEPGQAPTPEPPAVTPPDQRPVAVQTYPRFTSKDGAFSVAYLPAADVTKTDDGITMTFDGIEGEIRLFGTPAENRTPRQIVEQYIEKKYRTAKTAYQIPNAMVGYEPGYGEVDDFSDENPNATSTRGRLLVMTAVRNGLALVAVAEGPMVRFTPRTSSHPSAVNMIIAQLMGNSVNSFTWNKPVGQ
ncbi:zinc ribbon domain-containing protein [Mycobacterium paraterrae]|uniref:Zinc ribbon domain-containing protein n=1 Tax=Mycobacterium paraterrae TaxID=577492 RepID=A0ABY3VG85_9MYCO|nr:zinc ribbon domain-containing protein [Mycobacterium paraterrae]UMB67461.1 zinc ribbon domain-containing protein [Mycobacterium paraterrae]